MATAGSRRLTERAVGRLAHRVTTTAVRSGCRRWRRPPHASPARPAHSRRSGPHSTVTRSVEIGDGLAQHLAGERVLTASVAVGPTSVINSPPSVAGHAAEFVGVHQVVVAAGPVEHDRLMPRSSRSSIAFTGATPIPPTMNSTLRFVDCARRERAERTLDDQLAFLAAARPIEALPSPSDLTEIFNPSVVGAADSENGCACHHSPLASGRTITNCPASPTILCERAAGEAQLGGVVVELARFGDVHRTNGGGNQTAPSAADQHDADTDVQCDPQPSRERIVGEEIAPDDLVGERDGKAGVREQVDEVPRLVRHLAADAAQRRDRDHADDQRADERQRHVRLTTGEIDDRRSEAGVRGPTRTLRPRRGGRSARPSSRRGCGAR